MTQIKVVEVKTDNKKNNKTIKLELTQEEAAAAIAAVDLARERFDKEIENPSRATRRAIKRGITTEKTLREHHRVLKSVVGKIGSAVVGVHADELEVAIHQALEEAKNAQ